MSSDDQYFFDVISSFPNDLRKYSNSVADSINGQVEYAANVLRDMLSNSPWVPQVVRPPKPPPKLPENGFLPLTSFERIQNWVERHRAWTAAIVAFVGTGALMIYRQRKNYSRKRRARKAGNGARKEVVVISGSPHEPIVRSLALDLERRGFIVFVVVSSLEEETLVHNEARVDIRPLHLDITDPVSASSGLENFSALLTSVHQPFPGSPSHMLTLAGILIVPPLQFPVSPLSTLPLSLISDNINTKLLSPILTTRLFVPTLLAHNSRLLVLSPAILPSLQLPFHALESSAVAGLDAFVACLRKELAPSHIPVSMLKLGLFDIPTQSSRSSSPANSARADLLAWDSSTKAAYAKSFISQFPVATSSKGRIVKGSNLRELNNAVFDALTVKRPAKVWRVGRGSFAYEIVGRWVPNGIVGWIMGARRAVTEDEWHEDSSIMWEKV